MEAKELLNRVVFDLRRGLVGRVKAVHEPGHFISPVNQKPVLETVLELETGDSVVAKPAWLETAKTLQPHEEVFYNDVQSAVQQVVKALCGAAVACRLPPKLTFLLVGRAFQVQGGILLKPEAGEPEGWDE